VAATQMSLDPQMLVPAESNPNVMDPERYEALVGAIRDMGFLQPILVRRVGEKFEVVDGHHRRKAALDLGYKEIPCVVEDYTQEETHILRLGMNRLRGELDLSTTAAVFASLRDAGCEAEQMALTGFSTGEIDDLLRASSRSAEEILPEAVEAPEEEPDDAGKTWTLEIVFTDKGKYQAARKGLKKAAGKGGELSDGLMVLLEEG
jgi:ParB/RepB/Spo0J family partition protein